MSDPRPYDPTKQSLSRRRVLQWGLTLPLCAMTLGFPLDLLAQALPPRKPALPSDGKTKGGETVPPRKPLAPRLLMIDPGHGGNDPGAIGLHGTQEKTITLDIAKRVADILSDVPGVSVKMTRTTDLYIPLKERVTIAQEARADLFLSLHADSAPNSGARGLSVYTLSEKASDDFAHQLADKENHADIIGGLDLSETEQDVAEILMDLTTRRTRNTAQRLKVDFVRGMGKNWKLLENPMRSANFAVLRSAQIPSMLVETGFLSNQEDEALLIQPKMRQKIAALMADELASLLCSPLFG